MRNIKSIVLSGVTSVLFHFNICMFTTPAYAQDVWKKTSGTASAVQVFSGLGLASPSSPLVAHTLGVGYLFAELSPSRWEFRASLIEGGYGDLQFFRRLPIFMESHLRPFWYIGPACRIRADHQFAQLYGFKNLGLTAGVGFSDTLSELSDIVVRLETTLREGSYRVLLLVGLERF